MIDEICYLENGYVEIKEHMKKYLSSEIVTCNSIMLKQIERINRIINTDVTVLINGETGTGKEVFAEYIHRNSNRKNKRYVKLNCSTIPDTLFESEMFGYSAGAFTGASKTGKKGVFELADNGTLFLDEIADMPFDMQSKLLRVIQDKNFLKVGGDNEISVSIRFIAASNKNLSYLIKEKKFRKDLYYRINVIPINLVPLRDRPEDIILMSFYFLSKSNHKYGYNKKWGIESLKTFLQYNWPGNIREIKNVIERLVLLTTGEIIEKSDIAFEQSSSKLDNENSYTSLSSIIKSIRNDNISLKEIISDYEISIIKESIKLCGSLRKAAELLQTSPATLSRKMNLHKKRMF